MTYKLTSIALQFSLTELQDDIHFLLIAIDNYTKTLANLSSNEIAHKVKIADSLRE